MRPDRDTPHIDRTGLLRSGGDASSPCIGRTLMVRPAERPVTPSIVDAELVG